MNYLSGALRYVAGGESDAQNVVPRLVDRIKTSVLPADRRAAIQQLIDAAKQSPKRQKQVGELAIKVVYAVLEQDNEYDDTIKVTLELLIAICGTLEPPSDPEVAQKVDLKQFEASTAEAAKQNADMFLALPDSISLLLQQLVKDDFYIKFGAIELFTAMAANSRPVLQAALLSSPQGVTRICDLLDDSHRHIRSNAVLLLSMLCDQSSEICKIVAFGGVLEKLFLLLDSFASDASVGDFSGDVLDEDSLEAGIVAHDVLLVIRNLVAGTSTTRTFILDSGCLLRLVGLVQRTANDAGFITNEAHPSSATTTSAGVKIALQRQARKNLLLSLQCVAGLVDGNDEESSRIKNNLCTTNILRIIMNLGFISITSAQTSVSESGLDVRLTALKTVAMLVRGHDELRTVFNSSAFSVASGDQATSPQILALRNMMVEPSGALRAAAYTLLRDSFVVDAGLDLPSSVLLNAMTSSSGTASFIGEARNLSRASLSSSGDSSSPGNAVAYISSVLKESLVGYPEVADAAGVFYAASLVSWVIDRVKGARERLLGSYVNGSSLLPQVFRTIGRLEREKGPPEVRISLFSLACVWLYESPSAVSAFLSSAMNLPMLVDVIRKNGTRGDIGEVHTRGLAAVLLGICLQATEGTSDASNDGGFLSGGGPSTVIPRGTVANVIRNRIGASLFTACLEDLRATRSFEISNIDTNPWKFAESLVSLERRNGFLSTSGSLGHENWYNDGIVKVVNSVYEKVGEKALDLVASSHETNRHMNGHNNSTAVESSDNSVIADSTRDEILNSYKELIRSQDDSLTAARQEMETLKAALQEAQVELDSKSNHQSTSKDAESIRSLLNEKQILMAEREELRSLLEEKESDFTALTEAYSALEEDQVTHGNPPVSESHEALVADLHSMRSRYNSLKVSFEEESRKNYEAATRATRLESLLRDKDVELMSITNQLGALKSGTIPSDADALEWRRRAEVAESKLESRQSELDALQMTIAELNTRKQESEFQREEAIASLQRLQQTHAETRAQLESLGAARQREMKASRESSAAVSAAAQQEIGVLRQRIAQMESELQNSAKNGLAAEQWQAFEQMRNEHGELLEARERMNAELMDTRHAVSEWQRRAQANESLKDQHVSDVRRLSSYVQELEMKLQSLNDVAFRQERASNAMNTRIAELQQQCSEIEEIRQRTEEESVALREELASRTEQSIRLSGQVYEIEAERVKLEEMNRALQSRVETLQKEIQGAQDDNKLEKSREAEKEELLRKVSAIENDLTDAREALSDSKDREQLLEAKANDRDVLASKTTELQSLIDAKQLTIIELEREVSDLQERLLSLDEAEEAKRNLTMEVVSLRKSLNEAIERNNNLQPKDGMVPESEVGDLNEKLRKAQEMCEEKEKSLSHISESLEEAKAQLEAATRESADLRKQIHETEAVLSVVQTERDDLQRECETAKAELESRPALSDKDVAQVHELEQKLQHSEDRSREISTELATLVQACKHFEKEGIQMKNEIESGRSKEIVYKQTVSSLQDAIHRQAKSRQVERVVSTIVLTASLEAEVERWKIMVNEATASCEQLSKENSRLRKEVDELGSKLTGMQTVEVERDDALAKCSEYKSKVDQMSSEVHDLRVAVKLGEEMKTALEAAKAAEAKLKGEKQSVLTQLNELESRFMGSTIAKQIEGEGNISLSEVSQKRITELEEALRDAARTVAATNLELISAQGLLVELSSDKSLMHAELLTARGRIEELETQAESNEHHAPRSVAISEVSEADHSSSDVPVEPSSSDLALEVSEKKLESLRAEAENLKSALHRSMSESDSALELIQVICESVRDIEHRLRESEESLVASKKSEKRLSQELAALNQERQEKQERYNQEKRDLSQKLKNLRESKEEAVQVLEQQVAMITQTLQDKSEELRGQLQEKTSLIMELQSSCKTAESRIREAHSNITELEENNRELVNSEMKLTSLLNTTEQQVKDLEEREEYAKQREADLQTALSEARSAASAMQKAFDEERSKLCEERTTEANQYEDEIGRMSSELEEVEKKMRNSELLMRAKLDKLEGRNHELDESLMLTSSKLETEKKTSSILRADKRAVETRLKEERELHEKRIDELKVENNELIRTIEQRKTQREALQHDLDDVRSKLEVSERLLKEEENARFEAEKENRSKQSTITSLRAQRELLERQNEEMSEDLRRTKANLKEETECKEILERENDDFLSTIESLESACKRLREDLILVKQNVGEREEQIVRLEEAVLENERKMFSLESILENKKSEIESLRETKKTLEGDIDDLRKTVRTVEASRDETEQDNKDLREWVSDLEKQARELHDALVNFEQVEQSLRETVELQQQTSQHASALREEVKEKKEYISRLEVDVQQAVREKEGAEAARASSQRRAEELESRIRKIREEHLSKFSSSEEAIREKAERCAKLETLLASAVREVAEKDSVCDELFGVKTRLRQREADLEAMKSRAEGAEKRAADITTELSRVKGEIRVLKENGSDEAFRAMEEEHNELLVYLADLEVEVTRLRGELGRE